MACDGGESLACAPGANPEHCCGRGLSWRKERLQHDCSIAALRCAAACCIAKRRGHCCCCRCAQSQRSRASCAQVAATLTIRAGVHVVPHCAALVLLQLSLQRCTRERVRRRQWTRANHHQQQWAATEQLAAFGRLIDAPNDAHTPERQRLCINAAIFALCLCVCEQRNTNRNHPSCCVVGGVRLLVRVVAVLVIGRRALPPLFPFPSQLERGLIVFHLVILPNSLILCQLPQAGSLQSRHNLTTSTGSSNVSSSHRSERVVGSNTHPHRLRRKAAATKCCSVSWAASKLSAGPRQL